MKKIAVITGASKGIGRACAVRLAKEGISVVINYYNSEEEAKCLANEIRKRGGDAMVYKADVSDPMQVKAMFQYISDTYERIDILVNNAGIVKDEFLMMVSQDAIDKSFDINVKSYFYCAQQAALKMYTAKKGKIINISSVSAQFALDGQTVYSATKGAIEAMTRTMAKELAFRNIQVNAVAPGFIMTEMMERLSENKKAGYLELIPMKRFGSTEEAAEIVAMLCSDSCSYMTGQVLTLDGGLSL